MEYKICARCGNRFFSQDCNVRGAWKQKKFYSSKCRVAHNNKSKYKLQDTQHNRMIIDLNREIKGKIIISQVSPTKENSDIETDTTNYEIETYGNLNKWDKKYKRCRDIKKKHVLIIVPDSRLSQYFDEIHLKLPVNLLNKNQIPLKL